MSARVILQPAGDSDALDHFVDTIEIPVAVSRIKSMLTQDQLAEIGDIFEGRTTIPVWGVTPGKGDVNYRKWQKIQRGDVTLFARNKKIFASSTTVAKIHNKALAQDLWQSNANGDTWEYVYFLDELTEQNISYEKFNQAVGYQPNYIIQGFNVLDETKSDLLLTAFDLWSSTYFPDVEEADYIRAVTALDGLASLDSEVISKGRIEQQGLRYTLFGKRSVAQCCICGRVLPVGLVWASHIKKRSACTLDEKKDLRNIVAPMCKLGCDELYEKKYISVNHEGKIIISMLSNSFPELREYLLDLNGKYCLSWNESNKRYFSWHFEASNTGMI